MQTVTSKDGTTIAYDRRGEGSALILVGGAFQYRALDQNTARLAELLAKDFTTYHYDRRGRGDSSDQQPYAKEHEIEDLEALIAEAGGSAAVFAVSSGCALALDASVHSKGVSKLALYEPSFVVDDSRPPVPEDYVEHINRLIAADKRGDAVAYAMAKAVMAPQEMVDGMRQSPVWPAFEAVAQTLAYDGAFVAELMQGKALPADRWTAVTMPTLVMAGGASPAWLTHAAQSLAQILPHAQYRVLEGQTHDVSPEVLAPVLKAFLKA